ncbi:PLDc N-terminal domain-containing protein [Nostoc sp.]|uniref:PLDc N-terminal domain-containing protein n=1 Tax=Nostoc sp. TaxID=1180 RepID=UPI003FA5B7C3
MMNKLQKNTLVYGVLAIISFVFFSFILSNILKLSAFYIILFTFLIVGLLFWLWVLIDCITKEPKDGNNRLVWILVILLTNSIGAIIYFFVRRPQRIKEVER